jgi:hypothetical protein
MNNYRKTASLVGVLYIIGTVAGILSMAASGPLREAAYLGSIAVNPNQIVVAALFILLMGLALALVPILLFPLLKKYNEVLALGYVVFRGALETALYIGLTISWLTLIALSLESAKAGAAAAAGYQALGTILLAGHEMMITILIIIFSLGALMLYTAFYRSQLIPRWLSVWGFIAILLHLSTAVLIVFRFATPTSEIIVAVNLPIFLQEMVMAVWLIAKGFNSTAIAAKVAMNSGDRK